MLERLLAQGTDCYRLFHGIAEGWPGLAVDRYGPLVLAQSFREPLSDEQLGELCRFYRTEVVCPAPQALGPPVEARELGQRYLIRAQHRGPHLFLDLRALRRWLLAHSRGRSLLNLFAYTGGAGLCARAGGASQVLNVDFSPGNLAAARANAALNHCQMDFLCEDAFPVMWQLAGLPVKGRGARRRAFQAVERRQFDLIVLDPPAFSKGPFGAVDLERDYQGLFKPCLQIVAPGGCILACNNLAAVSLDDFRFRLERCASKAGRPLAGLEVIPPEADFPSPDGRPPLKMVLAGV